MNSPVSSTIPAKPPVKRRYGIKFLQIMAISAGLGIALFVISLLTWERSDRQESTLRSITQGWGSAQTLAGPVLAVPYHEEQTIWDSNNKPQRQIVTRTLLAAPKEIQVHASLPIEKRYR